jgi:type II secretory pathway component PulF
MAKHRFAWRGVNRQGEIQNGVLHADNPEEVSHELKQQRIRVTRIQRQFDLPSWLQLKPESRISARDTIHTPTRNAATRRRALAASV